MSTMQMTLGSTGTRRREVARAVPRLLLAWGIIFAVVFAVGEALTGPLKGSVGVRDNQVERWFAEHRSGSLTTVADDLSLLGETTTVLVLGPVLMVVVWLWRRELRSVAFLAVALLGELAGYLVVVSLVSRPRPPVAILDPGLDPTHSYPSGHVAVAVAMYGGLAVLIWIFCGPRWRWLSATLVVLPLLVAVARLYLGAHHPSDVLASLVYMAVWLAVAAAVLLTDAPGRSYRH